MLLIFSIVGHLIYIRRKFILDRMKAIAHGLVLDARMYNTATNFVIFSAKAKIIISCHHHFSHIFHIDDVGGSSAHFWAIVVNIFTSSIIAILIAHQSFRKSFAHSVYDVFFISFNTFSIAQTHTHAYASVRSLSPSLLPFDVAQIGMHGAYELKRKLKSKISVSCVDSRHST